MVKHKIEELFSEFILLGVLLFIFFFSMQTAYASHNTLSYNGYLLDNNGTPISSTKSMTFRIYDVPSGGSELWNEFHIVPVSNGSFQVQLGEINKIDPNLFLNDNLYIGIQIGLDDEMTPRKQLSSEGFIFNGVQQK